MNLLNPPRLDKKNVKKSFNRSAQQYDHSAILQREVLTRLEERLDYIKLQPSNILDIGCGTGQGIKKLHKRYKKSKIYALDLAFNMLIESKQNSGWLNKAKLVNADMENIPLKNKSFELIFSNLAIQWVNDLDQTLSEFKRLGIEGGLLMFTTFGPNTLWQLNHSWNKFDSKPHVHQFIDMHDIGDALVKAGFKEPVIDSENITMEYAKFRDVLSDLKNIGANNADKNRSKGLLTPNKLKQLEQFYREIGFKDSSFQADYEIIYGHAWF